MASRRTASRGTAQRNTIDRFVGGLLATAFVWACAGCGQGPPLGSRAKGFHRAGIDGDNG